MSHQIDTFIVNQLLANVRSWPNPASQVTNCYTTAADPNSPVATRNGKRILGVNFPWFVAVFFVAMVLMICSNILAYVFRKPGVDMSVYMNGYPDEPAPSGFFQMRRLISYVREDKVKLVYWIAFAGAFLFMVNILFVLVIGLIINPR